MCVCVERRDLLDASPNQEDQQANWTSHDEQHQKAIVQEDPRVVGGRVAGDVGGRGHQPVVSNLGGSTGRIRVHKDSVHLPIFSPLEYMERGGGGGGTCERGTHPRDMRMRGAKTHKGAQLTERQLMYCKTV